MDTTADNTDDAEGPVGILVVDDHAENRLALRAVLSSPRYHIVEAASGAEALRRLLDQEFAVLLIDVVMPEMNGFELAAAIRQRQRTAAVPILFLTGEAQDVDLIHRGYFVGAVDYLVKPLIPEMVRAKISVFVELYRQRKRIERQSALLVEAERKEGELRLVALRLANERRYRILAEAVPNIVWTARADGRIDYFNPRWYEYTGLSAEQSAGSWEQALHPDDVERCGSGWRESLGSGEMLEVECRLRRASDGSFRWHLCRAVPEHGPSGQLMSWLGTFTDIEDQMRAQATLARFKGTLDAVLDAVMIFEPGSWRFLYLNQGARMLLDYFGEDVSALGPCDLMEGYDESRLRELLAPLQDGSKGSITVETRTSRNGGRAIPVELSFQLIRGGGDHFVSIARDITERKVAETERAHLYEEALAAIRSRDEFLSVASHELRTPLSTLKLQIEMLLRPLREGKSAPIIDGRGRDKLDRMERQIDRLNRLISELMDVTTIAAGKLRLERAEVNLVALARDVVGHFKEEAARAGCALTFRGDRPLLGWWDGFRMEQVITNLLANALKYGGGKPVEVSVAEEGRLARLVVRDHGIGLEPQDAERIFERFERASSATSYAGLGLGLYIVRQIVSLHGGAIRVDSRPGEGAAFTVELPLGTGARRPEGLASGAGSSSPSPRSS